MAGAPRTGRSRRERRDYEDFLRSLARHHPAGAADISKRQDAADASGPRIVAPEASSGASSPLAWIA